MVTFQVARAALTDPPPVIAPTLQVARVAVTGTVSSSPRMQVARVEASGATAVLLQPLPSQTVEPLALVTFTATPQAGFPTPDGYAWTQVSGAPITFLAGTAPNVRVIEAPPLLDGGDVVVAVRAVSGGVSGPEQRATITVRPHLKWRATATGWVPRILRDLPYTAPTVVAPNAAPTAAFDVVVVDSSVAVDASASADPDNTISGYGWTFGDGGTATGVTASHTYTTDGAHSIVLTVTDSAGATGTATQQVTTPAPTPTPTLTVNQSDYPDGASTWPIYLWLPPGSTMNAGSYPVTRALDLILPDNAPNYRIVMPERFVGHTKRLGINGGNSWWITGMDCEFTGPNGTFAFTPGKSTYNQLADFGVDKNQFLHINGSPTANTTTKVRILEGFRARGQWFLELITHDGKADNGDTTLIVQNGHADLVSWVDNSSAGGTHLGGDVLQAYGPLRRLRVRGLTVDEATYQGFMLQQTGAAVLDMERVDIRGSRTYGNGVLLFDAATNGGTRANVIGAKGTAAGVYLDPNPADAGAKQTNNMSAALAAQITFGTRSVENVPAALVGVAYAGIPTL